MKVLRQIFNETMIAWPSGSQRRLYDGHDCKVDGSTSTQASLLHPWIRCFTTVISAWWNLPSRTSSKLKKSEAKFKRKTWKQGQLLSESGFVLCIAPPSLSRDRRINMKKSKKKINHQQPTEQYQFCFNNTISSIYFRDLPIFFIF